jgi:NAD(P)H dehydrogenase (quinone)
MILVTGAAGKTGRAVIEALLDRGTAVRAWVRRPAQVAILQRLGVTDIVMGGMGDTAVYQQAATGVRAIYHICPNMHPDEVALGRAAIAAAQAAGVAHFVYHSVLHPQTEKMPHHWHKLRVEEVLLESGLPFTILQPAAYMQNINV